MQLQNYLDIAIFLDGRSRLVGIIITINELWWMGEIYILYLT